MMGEPERGSAAWWEDRYRGGDIPWDTGVVPPELVTLVAADLLTSRLGAGSGVRQRSQQPVSRKSRLSRCWR